MFLSLSLVFSSTLLYAGNGGVRRNPNAVKDEYIVVFNDDFPHADIPAAAKAVSNRYGGGLRKVWSHAIEGFHVVMPAARAEAMSHDPQAQPDPAPDHAAGADILWHLDRLDGQFDNAYRSCATGSNVTVYVVDTGVRRAHGEFIQANVKDGYAATEGGPWIANTSFFIGDRIRDSVNQNTWICINAPFGHGKSGTGAEPSGFSGGVGAIVSDNVLTWQNFGKSDPAYNPCQAAWDGGWPEAACCMTDQPSSENYLGYSLSANNFGHGTSTASLVAGRHVGVAQGATIVPVKVARCDGFEPRNLVANRSYQFGQRIIANGQVWICSRAGVSSTSTTTWLTGIGIPVSDPSSLSTLQWTYIGNRPGSNDTIEMAIDGMDWILDPVRHPGTPINHTIATFSTYRLVGASSDSTKLTGAGSYEEAVQNLINAGVTVFASANNQNADACLTSPARLSRGNTDNTLGDKRVITVGGSMLSNANGIEGRWVCGPLDACSAYSENGSNSGMCVTLFAPARNIRSALMTATGDYRHFIPFRELGVFSDGTSFSAPMAAGVGAQFLQVVPTAGPNDVYNAIVNSATKGVLDPATLQGNAPTAAPNRLLRTTEVWIYSSPTPAPQTVPYGTQVNLSVSAAALGGVTYQWYAGALNDTSTPLSTAATQSIAATTTQTYWCRVLTASCNGGTASLDSPLYSVIVTDAPPVASFLMPCSGLACTANASSSTDDHGITAYAWSWGDGQPNGSGVIATHTYAAAGTYTVTLTVTDTSSQTGTASLNKTVSACVTPVVTEAPTVNPTTITSGQNATLQAGGGTGTTPLTFEWYTSNGTLIGTGKKLVVHPTATTTYYYMISNACGRSAASSTVTVTVQ